MMMLTCPPNTPFLPPSCADITRAASADATLAGLLATAASVFFVLVLQAKKSDTVQATRKTVLSLSVSAFFSTLLASFIFGLLTGEMPSFRTSVLLNVASPALAVGVMQFLSSIGWLLAWHQAGEEPLNIAKWALHIIMVLIVVYLALDYADLLNTRTNGVLPAFVYDSVAVAIAILTFVIALRMTKALPTLVSVAFAVAVAVLRIVKTKRMAHILKSRQKDIDYNDIYAKSGLFIAASVTLLYGIMSDFSPTILQSWSIWIYYFGALLLMVTMGGFVCLSQMSWLLAEAVPSTNQKKSPAGSSQDQILLGENHTALGADSTVSAEAPSLPSQEPATLPTQQRSGKKPADSSEGKTG